MQYLMARRNRKTCFKHEEKKQHVNSSNATYAYTTDIAVALQDTGNHENHQIIQYS